MSQEWPQMTQTSNTESREFPFLLSRVFVPDASNCRAQGRANKEVCESLGRSSQSLRPRSSPPCLLTWVVLPRTLQPLGCMHADIVLGVDDLSIQDGGGPATAPRGEGQEVRGLGGGPAKEAAQRHG